MELEEDSVDQTGSGCLLSGSVSRERWLLWVIPLRTLSLGLVVHCDVVVIQFLAACSTFLPFALRSVSSVEEVGVALLHWSVVIPVHFSHIRAPSGLHLYLFHSKGHSEAS